MPRVERGEFINVGIILFCRAQRYLEGRIELDEARLLALYPAADLDEIKLHLAVIPKICAGGPDSGPIGQLSQQERFHWLVAPRSTIIQVSPVHSGLCSQPAATLEHLMNTLVR
jgi:hypothetical protein